MSRINLIVGDYFLQTLYHPFTLIPYYIISHKALHIMDYRELVELI